jgi:levansucrase
MTVTTTRWTREHVAAFVDDPATWTPVIPDEGLPRLVDGTDFWDLWVVRTTDGEVAELGGREVWAGLSAPAVGHPGDRHGEARIRLIARRSDGAGWEDLGPLFPDGASAGSREWAGREDDDGVLLGRGLPGRGRADVPAAHLHGPRLGADGR